MASSAHHHHHHLSNTYGATAAPPPTPSNQSNILSTSEASADALSFLLHRLPPTLNFSLRSRKSSDSTTTTTTIPPLISLSENDSVLHSDILSAASSHGFFELTDHSISSDLAISAESESISLFNLTHEEKSTRFPMNWPLGYDTGDDDDVNETGNESFCFDSDCPAESTHPDLSSLVEFTREMKKLGMEVTEKVFQAFGLDNLTRGVCGLMWVSSQGGGSKNKPNLTGRMYPYVVGLQYRVRSEKHTMLTDAGWVSVSPRTGSVLVTLGDIAQVWCNGKLKKVRSRPLPVITDDTSNNNANSITMTLLLTLPLESIVTPLLPKWFFGSYSLSKLSGVNHDPEKHDCESHKEEEEGGKEKEKEKEKEERLFNTFSFEDYAWRIYHERLPSTKDPLVRYRV